MRYILDTNLIIDYLEGKKEEVEFVQKVFSNNDEVFLSVITEIELGVTKDLDVLIGVQKLLENFKIISLDRDIAKIATDIRLHTNLKLPDSVILATALYYNAILITKDKQLISKSKIYARKNENK